ncbi:hypothetical protein Agub_g7652 [Astrephomene gubernaculifera]|uniref:Uncharacterized protein n=1 Tax=Astrephomene gubernaculifera TaxID=47775 RepID=A0AAD3DT42_9CHLO|nr:hypothetical protein Agub_g7652 [Astrephomene gubernaculifera]
MPSSPAHSLKTGCGRMELGYRHSRVSRSSMISHSGHSGAIGSTGSCGARSSLFLLTVAHGVRSSSFCRGRGEVSHIGCCRLRPCFRSVHGVGCTPCSSDGDDSNSSSSMEPVKCGGNYRSAGLYGMNEDELLELLWQSAGLRALEFLPALPYMAASPRYMLVSPSNLAAWVSLMTDLQVQSPAALLAPCPAFLLVPLATSEQGAEYDKGEDVVYGSSQDCEDYGSACRTFVFHLRDELRMGEEQVFGLLARRPSLAFVPPAQLDAVIAFLAVVIKGAGRGHRLGSPVARPPPLSPPSPALSGGSAPKEPRSPAALWQALHELSAAAGDVRLPYILRCQEQQLQGGLVEQCGESSHSHDGDGNDYVEGTAHENEGSLLRREADGRAEAGELSEEAELDRALYRFLRRVPEVLAIRTEDLSYGFQRLSYLSCTSAGTGGLGYVDMCRMLCAVPELLPAVAAGKRNDE